MAACSMDVRTRVLEDGDAGMRADAVAEKYRVSLSWVNRLKQRRRETGEIAPRLQIRWRTPILTPVLPRLEALIAEQSPSPSKKTVRASEQESRRRRRRPDGVATRHSGDRPSPLRLSR